MTALSDEVLRRLNVAAPRYTSYPTVPEWSSTFGPDDHASALRLAAKRADEPLSLYVHIPFCRELCTYCGCNVVVSKDSRRADAYLDSVARELAMTASLLGDRRRVARLHLGGGTPTFLDERQLRRLWDDITSQFSIDPGAEIALEIDPVVTSAGQLALLGSLGFNRLSMGVQDFDPEVQRAVNRVQSVDETRAAIEYARKVGFKSVNLDLIYGLPRQTDQSFARTMDEVVALRPDRVAVFSFAYVPDARPNQRKLAVFGIPSGQRKLALLEVAQQRLGEAGYRAIGMDHFARPEDELAQALERRALWRDFQGYTTRRARDTVAVGASGISDLGHAYAQTGFLLGQYGLAVAAGRHFTQKGMWLDDEDRRRRDIIVQLMCNGWVDLGARGETEFAAELDALAPLERDGLLSARGREIALTDLGRTFVRNVAMVFDRYLEHAPRRTFSSVV